MHFNFSLIFAVKSWWSCICSSSYIQQRVSQLLAYADVVYLIFSGVVSRHPGGFMDELELACLFIGSTSSSTMTMLTVTVFLTSGSSWRLSFLCTGCLGQSYSLCSRMFGTLIHVPSCIKPFGLQYLAGLICRIFCCSEVVPAGRLGGLHESV